MSGVSAIFSFSILAITPRTLSDHLLCPKNSSICAALQIVASGFASPFPAMSGALPWIGSNIDGNLRSGFRLAPAARPIPPEIAAPRSVRMSPNRFDATTIWKRFGSLTMNIEAASTRSEYVFTSGYSAPTSLNI